MRRLGFVVVMVLLCSGAPSAAALPPGPPTVSVVAVPTGDEHTFNLVAEARDPDGRIQLLSICVDDEGCWTEETTTPGGLHEQMQYCVQGDSRRKEVTHTFGGPGTYVIRASVETADGCPVLGGPEQAETEIEVRIFPPPEPIPCADEGEPGATDTGVTPQRIELGATVVAGFGAAQFGDVEVGIRAAEHRVNRTGGVCGRTLHIETADDGADAGRGQNDIRNFIKQGKFALVATAPTEGLSTAIEAGDIDDAQIPVVGSPGLLGAEFTSPWVWPVGLSSARFGRIAVRHAYDRGARRFGIVYDSSARYASEVLDGVHAGIAARPQAQLVASVGIPPGHPNYSAEVQAFAEACGSEGCDAVLFALDPFTAATWMAGRPPMGTVVTSGLPFLFSERFGQNCGRSCHGFHVWTGFRPPIGSQSDAMTEYMRDVRAVAPGADLSHPSIQASYVGTMVLAHALGRTGVNLTRPGLRAVLDAGGFDLGLTAEPLTWVPDREANRLMRPYSIVVTLGGFSGYREEGPAISDGLD